MIGHTTLVAALLAAGLAQEAANAAAAIRPESLSAHIRFLSDPLLEGREPGTPGHAIAERFVASELAALGLEPGGDGGSWFQPVPIRATRVIARDERVLVKARGAARLRLASDREVLLFSSGHQADVAAEAPLVYAGYGITAPEYGHDDLAGLDLRGKIAVVLFGAPRGDDSYFPPTASAWYSRGPDKARRLRERGAIGMLVVRTPAAEKIYPWSKLVRDERTSDRLEWLDGGRPGNWPPGMPVLGFLSQAGFERVLELAQRGVGAAELLRSAEARRTAGMDLGLGLQVRARATFRALTANNVVGLLRGSDPELSREVLVLTAHIDHLGAVQSEGRKVVYPGAIDNASGVAGLLAVARAFRAAERPRRSILFLAVTGEEGGYAGSRYFVRFPPVPREAIVANVNLDVLPFYPSFDLVALGETHSTLAGHVRGAGDALGMAVSPDPTPEQVLFIRSDQASFVEQGIPSVWLRGGVRGRDGDDAANRAKVQEYRARYYHEPGDGWRADLDFEAMARVARAAYLVSRSVADAVERPRWNPGDFFEQAAERRAAQRAAPP